MPYSIHGHPLGCDGGRTMPKEKSCRSTLEGTRAIPLDCSSPAGISVPDSSPASLPKLSPEVPAVVYKQGERVGPSMRKLGSVRMRMSVWHDFRPDVNWG